MTLFDLMPSVWLILAFSFLLSYFISDRRIFLYGCGGAFFALCPSVLCFRIYVQCACFFAYLIATAAASGIAAAKKDRASYAVALTRIDSRGGLILYKGAVCSAYPRDEFSVFRIGDVLKAELCSNGLVRADRI